MKEKNQTLSTMIDKSNVEAVNQANKERDDALNDKKLAIADCERQIAQIRAETDKEIEKSNEAVKDAIRAKNKAINDLDDKTRLYIGMLSLILIIIALKSNWFISDIKDFIVIPFIVIKDAIISYIDWITAPYVFIVFKILSVIGILGALLIIFCVVWCIALSYKEDFDNRHLVIAVVSFAALCVFGDMIKNVININMILVFIIIQILMMFLLKYLDSK